MNLKFTLSFWVLACLRLALSENFVQAQTVSDQTPLIPSPRQSFTPTPQAVRGYWNIDVVGDFTLPATKSITFCGAGRNLHVNQDWSKLFRRGFSSIEKSRMTPEEIRIDYTPINNSPTWRSRLNQEQRAMILYQNYFTDQPFNLQWAKDSELARYTYFQQPAGSSTPRQSIGSAMTELVSGCALFNDCPSSGTKSTFGKIYFDIENEGTSIGNRQEHANIYAYKMWALRNVISPNTLIGGIGPVPHNSYGYSRSSDYQVTTTDWLWSTTAQHINETNTRGRGMPDAVVGKSFGDQADFAMPGTYFLSSDLDYSAPHNGDEDRHWLASLLGEQEVNIKITSKKRIAWQWLFNTQSRDPGQATRAEYPAPPVIAEGLAIFYWFTGAYGTIFWDDWDALTPNAPVVPGRENLDNNRNYACYEHYIHGLWRLFKHHGDMFNGQEKYINEQTECSYDGGRTWYRLNANALKRSGMPFVRVIVNGNQILVAATNAYASANTQKQVMVRYVQDNYRFYSTINLTGDEIFLARATMPTGNSSYTSSSTEIGSVTNPTNPSGGALAATVVNYNCSTGAIAFGKTGGTSAVAEYLSIGITGWSSNTNQYVESGLRADPKPLTIRVRQNGVEGTPYVFDMQGYCNGNTQTPTPTNTAPTVVNLVNSQVATVGTSFALNIGSVFTDIQTPNQLYLSASGLPAGLSLSGNTITGIPLVTGASTVVLTAIDPGGLQASTTFLLTVNASGGGTVNPPIGQPLAATVVNYHCASGVIVLGKTGGDNNPVEYFSIGITGWTTNTMHVIEAGLRADPKPITIRVRQNGVEGTPFILDLRTYCGTTTTPQQPSNTSPTLANRVSAQSATLGVNYSLNLGSVFTDAETPNQLVLTVTGLPAGLSFANNVISGTPTALGASSIFIVATDPGGLMNSSGFVLTVSVATVTTPPQNTTSSASSSCGSPANTIGQTLQVVGLRDINCQNGSFRIVTTGGSGAIINYANIIGLNNSDPNNCLRSLDNTDLLMAINNPASNIGSFQIRITQGGTVSNTFTFNFKQYCTGVARVAQTAEEAAVELNVRLLGNPSIDEWAVLEIDGANEESVTFQVLDIQGREISNEQADPSSNTIRQRVWLGRSPGIRLVKIVTPTRNKTLKVVKQ